jgi:hypothetical protein
MEEALGLEKKVANSTLRHNVDYVTLSDMPAPSGTMDRSRAVQTGLERFDRLDDFSYGESVQNSKAVKQIVVLPASLAVSASKSYRLFLLSRCTTTLKSVEVFCDCWQTKTLLT